MQRQVRLVALALALSSPARAEAPAPDHAEGKGWAVRAALVGPIASGKPARLEIHLEATGTFHLNDDYPINLVTLASDGVAFSKPRFDRKDGVVLDACSKDAAHHCRAMLPATFTPSGVGRAGGTISFSACDAEQCLIQKVAISVPVPAGK